MTQDAFPTYREQRTRFLEIIEMWRYQWNLPTELDSFVARFNHWIKYQIPGTLPELGFTVDPTGKRMMVLKNARPDGIPRDPEKFEDRMVLRFGGFLKHIEKMGFDFFGMDQTKLAEQIGSHWPTPNLYEYEVLYGKVENGEFPINKAYNEQDFGSCMAGQPYTRWYDQNPQTVGLLTQRCNGELTGRALLWRGKYVDRIYPGDTGEADRKFVEYVENHADYVIRSEWRYEGLEFSMKQSDYGYPYMDTPRYCIKDHARSMLIISSNSRIGGDDDEVVTLDSQYGDGPTDMLGHRCPKCQSLVSDENRIEVADWEDVCPTCAHLHFRRVEYCRNQPSYSYRLVHKNNCALYDGKYYLYSDLTTAFDYAKGELVTAPRHLCAMIPNRGVETYHALYGINAPELQGVSNG